MAEESYIEFCAIAAFIEMLYLAFHISLSFIMMTK